MFWFWFWCVLPTNFDADPHVIIIFLLRVRMFSYLATSFIGFEAVCESEIRQKLKPHSVR